MMASCVAFRKPCTKSCWATSEWSGQCDAAGGTRGLAAEGTPDPVAGGTPDPSAEGTSDPLAEGAPDWAAEGSFGPAAQRSSIGSPDPAAEGPPEGLADPAAGLLSMSHRCRRISATSDISLAWSGARVTWACQFPSKCRPLTNQTHSSLMTPNSNSDHMERTC